MPLQPIPDLPAATIGFRASGVVTAKDYTAVLDPAIRAAVEHDNPVNLVYVLGPDFDRYALDAMWQDLKLIQVPRSAWGRIALVTDHRALGEVVHLFGFLIPAEVRVFPVANERDAIAWAG
ncbi:STAS/SEC14 domain-containing protein [Nocardia thailandica]|uniref:STAS/SEC14 domain-containing protein n=1 Tax=Nocardia thailandica TaxID=257275 RepID=UPI0002FAD2DF|nr:STAS/SEC14 domain-containing protein [Nocardia thailandica]